MAGTENRHHRKENFIEYLERGKNGPKRKLEFTS